MKSNWILHIIYIQKFNAAINVSDTYTMVLTEYRKSAIAPEVIWSGISVEGMVRREGTQEYFASVYPIWEEHQILSLIHIFGIHTDAVCTIMRPDGTILGRKFINLSLIHI